MKFNWITFYNLIENKWLWYGLIIFTMTALWIKPDMTAKVVGTIIFTILGIGIYCLIMYGIWKP